jgi:hemin uptake protein HemP
MTSEPARPTPPTNDLPQQLPLPANTPVWKSETLLDGKPEAAILHEGQVYRLRCTRQGKLILYK